MSSLIAFLKTNYFVIATDTLAHTKNEHAISLVNFCTKTYYLPQFKCCFAGQGSAKMLNQYFIFAQENIIAKDINSLIVQTGLHFKANIQESSTNNLGTIFLFGVSDLTNTLEAHKITLTKSSPYLEISELRTMGLLHKPEVANIETFVSSQQNNDVHELLVLLMKEQKKQDDIKTISKRAVIGGQIQITSLYYDDQTHILEFNIGMLESFPDFELMFNEMIK